MIHQKFKFEAGLPRQVLCSSLSSLAYLSVGLVRAWASTAVPSLSREEEGMSEETISWVVATPPIGAITGSLLSFFFLDKMGRKVTMLSSGVLFLTAFLCLGLASLATSQMMLRLVLVFRAVSGTAVGLAVPSVSIFIAETVAAGHRGTLSCLPALLHATGILLCYVAGAFLPWNILSYVCCIPSLLLLLTVSLLPETPAQLARQGRLEDAMKSYVWYRAVSQDQARKEVETLASASQTPSGRMQLGEFCNKATLYPLLITLVLQAIQNWCGVNVIVFKTVHVFQTFQSSVDNYLATGVVGGVQLLATFMSLCLMDRIGRRPLLIISGSVMALSMSGLALYLTFLPSIPQSWHWLPLLLIITAFTGYSVGFSTVPLSLIGELLPSSTKNLCGALCSSFNLLSLFFVLKYYTALAETINYAGVYWMFAGVSSVGVVFVYCFLPETKGKSLEEIEKYFK